ncbi:hypothetical protein KO361_03290 [Candidatus Woesearchaeota archaeon]|nr:hypothetical protein [Candidatus Woesearchaeota archaeon]
MTNFNLKVMYLVKKRGQVSIEYLAIFSVAALMIIPLVIIFASQTNNIEADIAYAQTENALSRIIDSAEEIYFQGPPAKKTLRVQFPKGVDEVIIEPNAVIFVLKTIDGTFEIRKDTSAVLEGTLKSFQGSHLITFQSFENAVYIEDK